ncbi:hypothetical protein [Methanoculleus sp.]|uniref:hypothetical protein n=1 Tax=Methanoculleus sp. TaxID=90427 RepID=UPI001BD2AC98|nr:hypothetical protein [Methanoculleus sp.]
MKSEYPNLSWLFQSNSTIKKDIFRRYGSKVEFLTDLNNLIGELRESGCRNMIERASEVNELERDFNPFLAEFHMAEYLCKLGNSIRFLPLELVKTEFPNTSPDIECENENIRFFVEVTYVKNSDSTMLIIEDLRDILKNYPYCVSIRFKEQLSLPRLPYQEKTIQGELIKKSMDQFRLKLPEISGALPYQVNTDEIVFTIYPSNSNEGYPGFFTSSCEIPIDAIVDYIHHRLTEKAGKWCRFPPKFQDVPYILALHCDDNSIDNIEMEELLYGRIIALGIQSSDDLEFMHQQIIMRDRQWENINSNKASLISFWAEIESASNQGWEDLLREKRLIPNDYQYLNTPGIYLTDPMMKNVSGVLFKIHNNFYFYPNPFSDPGIIDPDIIKDLRIPKERL